MLLGGSAGTPEGEGGGILAPDRCSGTAVSDSLGRFSRAEIGPRALEDAADARSLAERQGTTTKLPATVGA